MEAAVALPVLLAATGLLLALVEWGVWTWTLNSAADAGAQALASGQSPAVAQVASVAAVGTANGVAPVIQVAESGHTGRVTVQARLTTPLGIVPIAASRTVWVGGGSSPTSGGGAGSSGGAGGGSGGAAGGAGGGGSGGASHINPPPEPQPPPRRIVGGGGGTGHAVIP